MGLIQLSRPWTEQPPTGAGVADSRVVALWRPGVSVYDEVTGRLIGSYDDIGFAVSVSEGAITSGLRTVFSKHDPVIPSQNVSTLDGENFTVTVFVRPENSASLRYYVGRGRDGLGTGWSVRVGTSATTPPRGYFILVHTSGGAASASVTGATDIPTGGAWITAKFIQGVGMYIYLNGRPDGSSLFSQTTLRSSTRGWYIGGGTAADSGTSNNPYGYVGDIAIWRGAISDAEIAENNGAPWSSFAPRRTQIFYSTAAAGLPTLSNARVTSVTTTTAVPLVDYTY